MDETNSLVLQIAELSRQSKAAIQRNRDMLRAAVDNTDYGNAVAAFQLFMSGTQTLREAYQRLDMRNLSFDYLAEKTAAELAGFFPFQEGPEAISLRDAMGVKGVALSTVQAAITKAAALQLPLIKATFEVASGLLNNMVVNAALA
jgi:hypothetical protein